MILQPLLTSTEEKGDDAVQEFLEACRVPRICLQKKLRRMSLGRWLPTVGGKVKNRNVKDEKVVLGGREGDGTLVDFDSSS